MKTLSAYIAYLLTRHDCVVLPRFGAFVCTRYRAHYDAVAGRYMPPQRTLGFNPELTHSDGLLVRVLAHAEGVDYARADRMLAERIDYLRHQLVLNGTAHLPGVGHLTNRGNAFAPLFEPEADGAYRSVGPFLPTLEVSAAETNVPGITAHREPQVLHVPRRRLAARVAGIAASLFILAGAGTVAYLALPDGDDTTAHAALLPSFKTHTVRTLVSDTPFTEGELCFTAAPATGIVDEPTHTYYIVVASLASESQARQYMAAQNDDTLQLLHADGRWRVYCDSRSSHDAAMALRDTYTERFPGAWVCEQPR